MSKTSVHQRIQCVLSAGQSLRKKYEEKHKVYYSEGTQWVGNPPRTTPKFTGNQQFVKNN